MWMHWMHTSRLWCFAGQQYTTPWLQVTVPPFQIICLKLPMPANINWYLGSNFVHLPCSACALCQCTLYSQHVHYVIVHPATPPHLPVNGPVSPPHMSGCKPAGEFEQMDLIPSVWIDSNPNDATCLIAKIFVIAPNYHLAIHCNKWQQVDLNNKRWYLQINEISSQSQWARPLVLAS